jgi:hypothetical protein
MSAPIYVVAAYRHGLRDAHSYVVGAYITESAAREAAHAHVQWRGGKYGCEVVECNASICCPENGGGNMRGQVYYAEASHFGSFGRNRPACQPADVTKNWLPVEESTVIEALAKAEAADALASALRRIETGWPVMQPDEMSDIAREALDVYREQAKEVKA